MDRKPIAAIEQFAAIFLPIAGAMALAIGVAPNSVLLPIALGASLGLMLPVDSGAVNARQMLRAGALLDVMGIGTLLGPVIFGGGE